MRCCFFLPINLMSWGKKPTTKHQKCIILDDFKKISAVWLLVDHSGSIFFYSQMRYRHIFDWSLSHAHSAPGFTRRSCREEQDENHSLISSWAPNHQHYCGKFGLFINGQKIIRLSGINVAMEKWKVNARTKGLKAATIMSSSWIIITLIVL